jgi:hypothetical protein
MERNIDRYNLLPLVPVYQRIRHLIWKIARIVLVPHVAVTAAQRRRILEHFGLRVRAADQSAPIQSGWGQRRDADEVAG